jgi:hypothetical protein
MLLQMGIGTELSLGVRRKAEVGGDLLVGVKLVHIKTGRVLLHA